MRRVYPIRILMIRRLSKQQNEKPKQTGQQQIRKNTIKKNREKNTNKILETYPKANEDALQRKLTTFFFLLFSFLIKCCFSFCCWLLVGWITVNAALQDEMRIRSGNEEEAAK